MPTVADMLLEAMQSLAPDTAARAETLHKQADADIAALDLTPAEKLHVRSLIRAMNVAANEWADKAREVGVEGDVIARVLPPAADLAAAFVRRSVEAGHEVAAERVRRAAAEAQAGYPNGGRADA